ncbi:hypothetical protein D032_3988 [Vibrio parahaemolyticus V14/01]|nr:hypothetical protein D032_3988 [Vibrio parahaemolyticus V14/01]
MTKPVFLDLDGRVASVSYAMDCEYHLACVFVGSVALHGY